MKLGEAVVTMNAIQQLLSQSGNGEKMEVLLVGKINSEVDIFYEVDLPFT